MKIVVNKCYGGFGLSPIATKLAVEGGVPCEGHAYQPNDSLHRDDIEIDDLGDGWKVLGRAKGSTFNSVVKDGKVYYVSDTAISFRSHPALVAVVEKLGDKANGACAKLKIVEVPDGIPVQIEEYDGNEHIAEQHRTW